jgi:hypothetical protein
LCGLLSLECGGFGLFFFLRRLRNQAFSLALRVNGELFDLALIAEERKFACLISLFLFERRKRAFDFGIFIRNIG